MRDRKDFVDVLFLNNKRLYTDMSPNWRAQTQI